MKKLLIRFQVFLSHHSYLYALIAGIGIILFWRGVWHSVDIIHLYISLYNNPMQAELTDYIWWDGPLSLVVGCLVLYSTRAFVSSFIGNELILSGLRSEKKLAEETESQVIGEVEAIGDIKEEIANIEHKLEELEVQVRDHHS